MAKILWLPALDRCDGISMIAIHNLLDRINPASAAEITSTEPVSGFW
jgi:hypothetical protein